MHLFTGLLKHASILIVSPKYAEQVICVLLFKGRNVFFSRTPRCRNDAPLTFFSSKMSLPVVTDISVNL